MTDAEKKAMLTSMTDESDDATLTAFLSMAADIVCGVAFPFGDGTEEMPSKYDHKQVRIAAYLINKRGADFETMHAENGISRYYESADVPPSLLRGIVPCAEVL